MNSKKQLGHDLEKYSLYDKEKLCTVIYADLTDKTVFAEKTAGFTGLEHFPEYLTLIFEVDAFFLNDDRHLNNIAFIEENGKYSYCPIFDNSAALLSNTQLSQMDIESEALISAVTARCSARPSHVRCEAPMLGFYPERDREIISERTAECIIQRQRFLGE